VNRVLEPGELLETATAVAREIATLPEGMPAIAKRSFLAQQPRLFES
jgi:enoyl-CoA hydratase/carnithine racemase